MILYRDSAPPATHLHLQLPLRLMPRAHASCFQDPLPTLTSGPRNPEGQEHWLTSSADVSTRAVDEDWGSRARLAASMSSSVSFGGRPRYGQGAGRRQGPLGRVRGSGGAQILLCIQVLRVAHGHRGARYTGQGSFQNRQLGSQILRYSNSWHIMGLHRPSIIHLNLQMARRRGIDDRICALARSSTSQVAAL